MQSPIHFTKMHGAGNDFIVLDALAQSLPEDFDFAAAAQRWCAHHFGIGADGLLLLTHPEPGQASQVRMRMWNPDGTEDMCGNGLRCVARLAHRREYVQGDTFAVQTLAGLRTARVLAGGRLRIAMGQPEFASTAIPMAAPADVGPTEYMLPVGDTQVPHVTSLSTGSTHTVIFVQEPLDETTFATLSPRIEHHPWFPERTSVLWAQVLDAHQLRLRIWERGVGETLACGTGACAAAVAARLTGRCGTGVDVRSRGGTLSIEWRAGHDIEMTGQARLVFEGRIEEGNERVERISLKSAAPSLDAMAVIDKKSLL